MIVGSQRCTMGTSTVADSMVVAETMLSVGVDYPEFDSVV